MSLSQHHDSGHAHYPDIGDCLRQKEAHKILNCTPEVKFRSAVQILSADKYLHRGQTVSAEKFIGLHAPFARRLQRQDFNPSVSCRNKQTASGCVYSSRCTNLGHSRNDIRAINQRCRKHLDINRLTTILARKQSPCRRIRRQSAHVIMYLACSTVPVDTACLLENLRSRSRLTLKRILRHRG